MRLLRTFAVAAAVFSTTFLSFSNVAEAQPSGFAVNRFDPSDRGSDWFINDSLDLRGHLLPRAGVVGDWGYKPLVLYNTDGSERGAIVEHQVVAHLGGSMIFWDRIRGGLNLPLALYQTGDNPSAFGIRTNVPQPAVGDLRLTSDVRLLGEYGSVFNSAVGLALYLPTGSRDNYTSDGNVRFAPRASVAGDINIFAYAARLGFNYRPLTQRIDANPLGSEFTLAASAGARLMDKKLLVGPELYGSTVTNAGSFFKTSTTPLEWLLGAHYTMGDFRFGGGFGTGLTRGWGTPTFRMVLSAEWVPAFDDDVDHDGVRDSEDACRTVPGIRTNDPKTNGCPPPPLPPPDRDGDLIIDPDDACPDTPGIKTDDPKTNGCPPPPPPPPPPPDRDNDGIVDQEDACPDVPGVKHSDPKRNGCPSDRDDDGITDADDACPDAPGPADNDPKKNGCPLARIEGGQVRITQQVQFKTGSADILRESDPVLIAVATILKEHSELTTIRIEGHTDNRGAAAMNKELSNKRAASVLKWLVSYGIDKKRLESKGFGLERPLDSNETDEGRQNNRRVEFHIATTPVDTAKPDPKAPTPAPKP